MRNSTFKKLTYEEAVAKKAEAQKRALERKKERDATKPKKATKKRTAVKKSANKKKSRSLPTWLKAIPESKAHGAGTYQKRLWRLTSDYVRIRDWYEYGVCAATGVSFEHWSKAHAGHLKPYSNCNGLYKFDVRNIHMQHGYSNKHGNYDTFRDFEKVVVNRGYDFKKFERENQKAAGCSLRDNEVEEAIKFLLKKMKKLPEQPAYFERSYSLLQNS